VLESAKFPAIEFRSRSVVVKSSKAGASAIEIEGELALHGRTRTMRVPAQVDFQGENLHATGKVKLKQTDFGISPTSAVAGTVKVADEVAISFEIYAKRR
jgi:polyisoprenoid-binding protein YceI